MSVMETAFPYLHSNCGLSLSALRSRKRLMGKNDSLSKKWSSRRGKLRLKRNGME